MAKYWDDQRTFDWDDVVDSVGRKFRGTAGDDHLVGTKHADVFHMQQGGDDIVDAGEGKDVIYMGASLTGNDRIDGGAAQDTLVLEGDYSKGLTLQTDTLSRIEIMQLDGAFDYSITLAPNMAHGNIASFNVDASQAKSLHIDGSAISYTLSVEGSGGDDVLVGGGSGNVFSPGSGHDVMTGGVDIDTFYFNSTLDSPSSNGDVIKNFDGSKDGFNFSNIDADPSKKGDQHFHFGATPNHVGDVTVTYDAAHDVTLVSAFTDKDANPDMVIQLLGNHTDLTSANFVL